MYLSLLSCTAVNHLSNAFEKERWAWKAPKNCGKATYWQVPRPPMNLCLYWILKWAFAFQQECLIVTLMVWKESHGLGDAMVWMCPLQVLVLTAQSSTQHDQGLIQDIRKQIIKYIILYQSEERPVLLGSSFDSPGAMETSVNVVLITPLEWWRSGDKKDG